MNHVFLSYRHESDDHAKAVRNLGEKLKAAGLPVELDQFYFENHAGGPDEGWRTWCEDRAEKSACALIVCSKGWFDSYRKEGPPGKGLGAAHEAEVLQLCSQAVIGWLDAPSGLFGFRSIQMASI